MASIQWANPPANAVAGGAKHTKWGSVAGMLKANPDDWGVVARKPTRTAAVALTNGIASGRRPEFEPAGSFESAYAEENDGRWAVYARFVATNGDGSAPADDDDDDCGEDGKVDSSGPF